MNIVVSANNNEEILVFPIIPNELQLQIPSNNEEFQTINTGTLNLIGDIGLRQISLNSIFPKNKETWSAAGSVEAEQYISFFDKYRSKKIPIRLIITLADGSECINMPVLVDNFNYSRDKNIENVRYTLDLKEYRLIV